MINTNHPITPPTELVQQWWDGTHGALYEFEAVVTQSARWGADAELDACVKWLKEQRWEALAVHLRSARRPKPPSLKEQALGLLNEGPVSDLLDDEVAVIRRALESLPD